MIGFTKVKYKTKFIIFALVIICNSGTVAAQNGNFSLSALVDSAAQRATHSPTRISKIHYDRLVLCSASLVALNVSVYQPFKETWWNEPRTHFHFYRGWRRTVGYWDFGWNDSYYGHIDKLGHYFSSKILAEQLTNLSNWVGFRPSQSQWIGPILSSLFMLEIEVYDGFFVEWGFSLADFAANEAGAFSPMLREKYPFLQNFSLKFSYHPSKQPQKEPTFIKDYAGQTYWLSFNLRPLLPAKIKRHYPNWLNLALGYGVSKQAHGDVELYLAPDVNWEKLYQGDSPYWKFFFHALNYLHFPSLTYKFLPENKFYWFYF